MPFIRFFMLIATTLLMANPVLCQVQTQVETTQERHKGFSGFSEITLKTTNTQTLENEVVLEQWNEIIYKDLNTQKQMGVQFSFKFEVNQKTKSDAEIYQLYLKQPLQDKILTVGRFEQIDSSGFYTLDGLSLKPQDPHQWWIYLGVPQRIDAYNGIDAGFLIGMEKQYDISLDLPLLSLLSLKKPSSRSIKKGGDGYYNNQSYQSTYQPVFKLGLQQQWDHGDTASYLTLAFGQQFQNNPQVKKASSSLPTLTRLNLSTGLHLDKTAIKNFVLKAEYALRKQGHIYLSYDHYRPPETNISFYERFYQSYASQQQDVLQADWHKKINQKMRVNLQLKQVWHQQGSNGQGIALGLHYQPIKKDWQFESRLDTVQLDSDYSNTLYARFKQPLSSTLKLELEAMVQQKQSTLSGNNQSQGIAFRLQRMLKKGLQLETYGEYIHDSNQQNEYQLGIRLRKDFFDVPWQRLR